MEFTNTERVLNEFGNAFVELYRKKLNEGKINASYELNNTLQYIVDVNGQTLEVVVMLQDYWKYIENGRRAGAKMPPISAIEQWIEVKPIIPKIYNGKLPTVHQLAYLIARSIANNGIPPKPILQQSIDELITSFYEKIEEAVKHDIENDITTYMISTLKLK